MRFGWTCHPASMLLRSEPLKEPDRIQSWERLKPLDSWMEGSQTLMVALAPYTGCCCEEGAVYAMACCRAPRRTGSKEYTGSGIQKLHRRRDACSVKESGK